MNRLNRRRFLALGAASSASVVLVACGNEAPSEAEMKPTQIPDVAGAPPTLAPLTSTPSAQQGGGDQAAGDQGGGGGTAAALVISALDSLAFDPSEADVSPGQTVTLKNDGFLQHNLAVDAWGGELTPLLNNGETADFTVPEDAAVGDTFEYYCTVPGHKEGGMVGTFTIVEAGAASGGDQQAATTEEQPAAGGGGEALTITTLDSLAFDPSEAEVSPGQTVTVKNDGFLQHDLAVDEWGGEMVPLLNNAESQDFTVPEDAEVGATFTYYCTVPGHREGGMEGTFTIVEASAAPSGGGEQQAAATQEASAPAEAAASGGGSAEPITIVTLDSLAFDPNEVEVAPGQTVTVRNDGFLQHDLAVDAWGGEMVPLLNNGESEDFTIPDDAAVGEQFEFYCTVAGHKEGGMVGTFTIVEGGAPAAGGGEQQASTPAEGGSTPEAGGESTPEAAGGDASDPANVTVVATEWSFAPADFDAVPGATITLMNEGTVSHGMAAESLGGTFLGPVRAGGTGEFRLPTDLKPGDTIEYTAVNTSAANLGMAGTITIIEGGAGVSASPAASPMASPAASPVTGSTGGSGGGGTSVEVSAVDLAFEPTELSIPADTDVEITLTNDGMLQHDFTIEDTDFQTKLLNGGESDTITVNLAAGDYTYFCSVPGHREAGMEGTLTVE